MSAALQLPCLWAAQHARPLETAIHHIQKRQAPKAEPVEQPDPLVSYGFYRRHTENLLRRYLYASMQVGRSPNILSDSVGRGWATSCKVRTFEDALIFVLDIERCLKKLDAFDREIIARVVLQEYTHAEAAVLIGISTRNIWTKLPQALDHLTEHLVEASLLVIAD